MSRYLFLYGYTDLNGSLTLREHPGDLVRLACEKCGRAGQYRKQNLIEQFGPDVRLPDLREEIAKCERARDRCTMLAACTISDWSEFSRGQGGIVFYGALSPPSGGLAFVC